MRVALVLALALPLAGPAAAQGRCLLGCEQVTTGAEAATRAQAALGLILPPEATVVGLVEGGFQDAFVQLRVDVAEDGLDAVLKSLGADRAAVRTGPDAGLGPAGPSWWEEARQGELRFAPATLPGFAFAVVGVGQGKGSGWTLLVWAFQT